MRRRIPWLCCLWATILPLASTAHAQQRSDAARPRSAPSSDAVTITWKNASPETAGLVWIDPEGRELPDAKNAIPGGGEFTGETRVGHVFVFNVAGRRLTYMIPDGRTVAPPNHQLTRKDPVQRIVINEQLDNQSRDLFQFQYENSTERGEFYCLNFNNGGYGSVWRKTSSGKDGSARPTLFFTEIARNVDGGLEGSFLLLRNPVSGHTVRLYSRKAAEIYSGLGQYQNFVAQGQGGWRIPK